MRHKCIAFLLATVLIACLPVGASGAQQVRLGSAAPNGVAIIEHQEGIYLVGLPMDTRGCPYSIGEVAAWLELSENAQVVFRSARGETLEPQVPAATGQQIHIEDDGLDIMITLCVSGDLTGSGKMEIYQVTSLARALIQGEAVPAAILFSGDLNGDGTLGLGDIVLAAKVLRAGGGSLYETLEEGMQSMQVTNLQRRLQELRYDTSVTGNYDAQTKAAVSVFQEYAGLDVTGVADGLTQERLYATDAPAFPLPLAGVVIGLDPGHQEKGNSRQEPIAPGSATTKPAVSSGTAGIVTKTPEYVINLAVGLRLRDLLEEQGATVVMSRETHDVNISNSERAQMMNEAGADLVLRLHCDGELDKTRHGAFMLIPSGPYTQPIQAASRAAAQTVLAAFIERTGARNLGLSERSDQTGFNWSTVPVINIEMGHLSNANEDRRLSSQAYQELCAQGLCEGIRRYFAS